MRGRGEASFNIIGTILVLTYMVLFSIVVGIVGIFLPLTEQVSAWLNGDPIPQRDFLWVFADQSCAETNWVDLGWDGKDLCRTLEFQVTSNPTINQTINFLMDLNVPAMTAVALFLLWRLVFFFMNI